MNNHSLDSRGIADFDLYPYVPSAVAGWVFVVLFGIAAVIHFVAMCSLRSWFFIPFVLGCIGMWHVALVLKHVLILTET